MGDLIRSPKGTRAAEKRGPLHLGTHHMTIQHHDACVFFHIDPTAPAHSPASKAHKQKQ